VPHLDFSSLSLSGWEFFMTYFRSINMRHGRFMFGGNQYTMQRHDMIGWSMLWDIAFLAQDVMVSDRASTLINSLLRSFADHLPADTNRMYHKCIDDCMQRLSICSAIIERSGNTNGSSGTNDNESLLHQRVGGEKRKRASPSLAITPTSSTSSSVTSTSSGNGNILTGNEVDSAERQIDRAFALLNSFFESFKGNQLASHASLILSTGSANDNNNNIVPAPSVPLTIHFREAGASELFHIVTFSSSSSTNQLRLEASKVTKWPPHLIRMIAAGKELVAKDEALIRVLTVSNASAPLLIHLVKRNEANIVDAPLTPSATASGAPSTVPSSPSSMSGAIIAAGGASAARGAAAPASDSKEKETKSKSTDSNIIPANAAAAAALPPTPGHAPSTPLIEHPSLILSSPAYFTQLFGLLSLKRNGRDRWAERAWSLLMRLPTDGRILQQLRGIANMPTPPSSSDAKWDELLPSNNIHRLHYSLQIVGSILNTQTSPTKSLATSGTSDDGKEKEQKSHPNDATIHALTSDTSAMITSNDEAVATTALRSRDSAASSSTAEVALDALEWKRNFVRFGAIEHLAKILIANDFTPNHTPSTPLPSPSPSSYHQSHSTQELECLSLLLKILLKFVCLPSPSSVSIPTPSVSTTNKASALSTSSSDKIAGIGKRRRSEGSNNINESKNVDGNDRVVRARTTQSSAAAGAQKNRGDDDSTDEEIDTESRARITKDNDVIADERLACLYQSPLLHQLFHFLYTVSLYPSLASSDNDGNDIVKVDKSSKDNQGKDGISTSIQRSDVVVDVVNHLVETLRCILCRARHKVLCYTFVLNEVTLSRWSHIILAATRSLVRKACADALYGIARYWHTSINGDLAMHRRILNHMITLLQRMEPFTTRYRETAAHFFRIAATLFGDISQSLALLEVYESQSWINVSEHERTRYGVGAGDASEWQLLRLLPLLEFICVTLKSYPINTTTTSSSTTDQSLQGLLNLTRSIVKANTHITSLQSPSTSAAVALSLTTPQRYAMARAPSSGADDKLDGNKEYGPQLPGASTNNDNVDAVTSGGAIGGVDTTAAATAASPISAEFKPPALATPASGIISSCSLIDHVYHRLLFDIRVVTSPSHLHPDNSCVATTLPLSSVPSSSSSSTSLSLPSMPIITSPSGLPPAAIDPPLCKTTPSR
jgi:hypothetical protein